jgi:hypothetical protein
VADKAKQVIDERGGPESLKEDADELREIADGPGSLAEKAKRAAEAIKEPGAHHEPGVGREPSAGEDAGGYEAEETESEDTPAEG